MPDTRDTSASVANPAPSALERLTSPLLDRPSAAKNNVNVDPAPPPLTVAETPPDARRHYGRRMSLLFFLCGLGSSLPSISILSSLVYFSSAYGDASFVYLNLAAYLPLLPIAAIQARYDQLYDEEYGSNTSFLFRGVVGYAMCAGAMAAAPLRIGLLWVCAQTFLMGTAGAVLQGVLLQMSAFVASSADLGDANGLKPAVSAGIQGSALVTLAVSVLIGFGSSAHNSHEHFQSFCTVIGLIEVIILLLFLRLMKQSRVQTSMVRRDSYLNLSSHSNDMEPVDAGDTISDTGLGIPQTSTNVTELSYRQLWSHTSYTCLCLFLTLVPSFLVGSWLTMIKTHNKMLPKILFYVRIGFDFVSRFFAGCKPPSSIRELLFISVCRLVLVVAFFVNASSVAFRYSDMFSIALVANIAFGSGYLVTGCYQLAPLQLPNEAKETNATKQAALLNLAFSFSALIGVLSSLVLASLDTTKKPPS